jgi:hypothetical protein
MQPDVSARETWNDPQAETFIGGGVGDVADPPRAYH